MSIASSRTGLSEDRLVLSGVRWRTYLNVLRTFRDRHLRITYDRGALAIMTLAPKHERDKHLLGLPCRRTRHGTRLEHCRLRLHRPS